MLQTADAAVILMTDLAENVDAITGETTVVCGSSSFSSAVADAAVTGDAKADVMTIACGSFCYSSSAAADGAMDADANPIFSTKETEHFTPSPSLISFPVFPSFCHPNVPVDPASSSAYNFHQFHILHSHQ